MRVLVQAAALRDAVNAAAGDSALAAPASVVLADGPRDAALGVRLLLCLVEVRASCCCLLAPPHAMLAGNDVCGENLREPFCFGWPL